MTTRTAMVPRTYSARRELVAWTFEIPAPPGQPTTFTVRRAVERIHELSAHLGKVNVVRWSSQRAGEHAIALRGADLGCESIDRALADQGRVTGALVEVDLTIEDSDATVALPGAMSIYVESEDDEETFLIVRLRTNAYAEVTTDGGGDNRAVARRNRGKLNEFLRALKATLGLRLEDLETGMYGDLVDELGFREHLVGPRAP